MSKTTAACKECNSLLPKNGDHVKCEGSCMSGYHYKCSGLSKDTWKAKSEKIKKEWRCKQCREKDKKINEEKNKDSTCTESEEDASSSRSSSSEEENTEETDNEKKKKKKNKKRSTGKKKGHSHNGNKELQDIRNQMGNMEKEIQELIKTVSFVMKENDTLKKEMQEMKTELKISKEEKEKIKKNMEEIKTKQVRNEQYERNKNLEIMGIRQSKDENLNVIMQRLAKKLNVEDFQSASIDKIHRVPKKFKRKIEGREEEEDNVIVQFKNRTDRDAWLKKKKPVTNGEIFNTEDPKRVFVNEHLTPENKALLFLTKKRAKEHNWKYVWVKDGRIRIRKEEGEKPLEITDEVDLDKIR